MAGEPAMGQKDTAKDGPLAPRPKPAGNPVFRMMGLPNLRFKLPSRNWLIFLSITGSFTTAVIYDRYQKKKAQQRWCNLVSHIAKEPLLSTQMPRRITIFLSAPPGDSLRAAREHFHEYVKPVLVAGALDWDVIEGRREGDVRAGLAEKIRKRRRKSGEKLAGETEGEAQEEEEGDLVQQLRDSAGIKDWEGVQGFLVLGRHTWKEYVRGLHEGWLGPLEPLREPSQASPSPLDTPLIPHEQPSLADDAAQEPISTSTSDAIKPTPDASSTDSENQQTKDEKEKPKEKPKQPTQAPPYISPKAYPSAPLAPSAPAVLSPSTVLPFPHLLGFLNTPIRIYRSLNRRRLADETGREVAALVLASHIRAWNTDTEFASSADPDASPSNTTQSLADAADVVTTRQRWEQEGVLEEEEKDWHKSAWQDGPGGEERVWKEQMVLDSRIGERMRRFELGADDEEKARNDVGVDPAAMGFWEGVKNWVGWEEDRSVKGWEHGLVEDESE